MTSKQILIAIVSICIMLLPKIKSDSLSDEEISAPSAILVEQSSGKVLYEKNIHDKKPLASITKVMTLLLVMEAIDNGKISLDDMVTTSEHAASMTGSHIWLKESEQMSVNDLIKATVVVSANDAAVSLAEHVSGTEEAFVEEMNKRANELEMKDTLFKNCNGLDIDGHVSSVYDISIMSRELLKHKEILKYTSIWMDYLRDGKTQLVSTNKLLRTYKGITGLKTGTTSIAKSCMSASATRDGMSLVSVVLASPTTKERFKDSATLLDFGFANYIIFHPSEKAIENPYIKVTHGMQTDVGTFVDINNDILIQKGKEKNIKYMVETTPELQAPIDKGQVVGKLTFLIDEEPIANFDIRTSSSVDKITFGTSFGLLLNKFFSM